MPGTASPETAVWAGRLGYTYVPFLVPFDIARELFDFYRQGAAEVGRPVTHDDLGSLICAVTADTRATARVMPSILQGPPRVRGSLRGE